MKNKTVCKKTELRSEFAQSLSTVALLGINIFANSVFLMIIAMASGNGIVFASVEENFLSMAAESKKSAMSEGNSIERAGNGIEREGNGIERYEFPGYLSDSVINKLDEVLNENCKDATDQAYKIVVQVSAIDEIMVHLALDRTYHLNVALYTESENSEEDKISQVSMSLTRFDAGNAQSDVVELNKLSGQGICLEK